MEVVEATPAGVFERSVLRALERWRYAPAPAETTEGVASRSLTSRLQTSSRK